MENGFDLNVTSKLSGLISKYNLPLELVANIGRLPFTTFKDKFNNKAPWKIKEIAYFALYFGVTTDEFIFGDKEAVEKSNKKSANEIKESIKTHLIENKKFKLLGKLTAEGFFKS